MFEQTFLDHAHTGARRPWPVAISLAGQSAFLVAILAVPLFQTARLAWTPPVPLVFMPPKPVVLEAVRTPISAAQAVTVRPVFRPSFTAPARIPSRIVTTPDPDPGSFLAQQLTGAASYADPLAGISASATIPGTAANPKPAAVHDVPKPTAVKVSAGVQAAKLIRQVKPPYPPLARAARIAGTVRLQAVIAPDGVIRNLQLVSGPPLLVGAALDAVKQWRYEPTLLNNVPVEVITSIEVNFTLSQ